MHSLALILTVAAKLVSGGDIESPPRFVTLIFACDSKGFCGQFRQPFDADNEVACLMTGAMSATRWMVEHPGYILKSFRCANAGERQL